MKSTSPLGHLSPSEPFIAPGSDEMLEHPILQEVSGARIVLPHEGGSLRTVITGSKKHPTGVLASRKTGFSQYWEGFPERLLILSSEVDHRVADYQAQPFRFEFVHGGRLLTYIADHVRQYHDGSVEVVEVKRTSRDLKDPDYQLKLGCVREICEELGWKFTVAFLSRDVVPRQLQRNLELIHSRRFATIGKPHLRAIAAFEQERGSHGEYGELSRFLMPGRPTIGETITQGLIAVGRLVADLTKPLLAGSLIRIERPAPTNFISAFRI